MSSRTPATPPATGPRIPISRFSLPTPTAHWQLRIINGPSVLFTQNPQTVGRATASGRPSAPGTVTAPNQAAAPAKTAAFGGRTIAIADPNKQMSRQHFRFAVTASNQPWIQDCDSLNGTLLYRAGAPIPVPTNRRLALRNGDVIRFGNATAIVEQR